MWQIGQLGVLQVSLGQIAGLMAAAVLVLGGFRVLWLARHRIEDQRVRLWVFGEVGHPTSLVVGLCLLGWGYHAAAYSLLPGFVLVAVPPDRWWILVVVSVVAVGGSWVSDAIESRDADEGR